jgi:HSP20 family molecular chaperone IbpA
MQEEAATAPSFRRSLTLPEGVDAEAVKATFDEGVLEVTVPKPDQQAPRKVQITVGGASAGDPRQARTAGRARA